MTKSMFRFYTAVQYTLYAVRSAFLAIAMLLLQSLFVCFSAHTKGEHGGAGDYEETTGSIDTD